VKRPDKKRLLPATAARWCAATVSGLKLSNNSKQFVDVDWASAAMIRARKQKVQDARERKHRERYCGSQISTPALPA